MSAPIAIAVEGKEDEGMGRIRLGIFPMPLPTASQALSKTASWEEVGFESMIGLGTTDWHLLAIIMSWSTNVVLLPIEVSSLCAFWKTLSKSIRYHKLRSFSTPEDVNRKDTTYSGNLSQVNSRLRFIGAGGYNV